jgi:signal transduction histidine kinase
MGGKIHLDSAGKNRGTTVTLTLPYPKKIMNDE